MPTPGRRRPDRAPSLLHLTPPDKLIRHCVRSLTSTFACGDLEGVRLGLALPASTPSGRTTDGDGSPHDQAKTASTPRVISQWGIRGLLPSSAGLRGGDARVQQQPAVEVGYASVLTLKGSWVGHVIPSYGNDVL